MSMLPVALFSAIPCCSKFLKNNLGKIKKEVVIGTFVFDLLAFITTLVIGILGALNIIGMQAAATQALFGINAAIVVSWIIIIAIVCCGAYCINTDKTTTTLP